MVFITIIIGSFLAYLIRIILARNLSIEGYGLFYAVFTFIVFFSLFKDIGLRNAGVKFIAEYIFKRFCETARRRKVCFCF